MDPWVYKFSKDNTDTHTQWHKDDSINQAMKEKWGYA
jgi:hypothetical protein